MPTPKESYWEGFKAGAKWQEFLDKGVRKITDTIPPKGQPTVTKCRECGGWKEVEPPPVPTWTGTYGVKYVIGKMTDFHLTSAIRVCEAWQKKGNFTRIVEYRNLIAEAIERGLVTR